MFRPFPGEEIAKTLLHAKAVAILDKTPILNLTGGPLFEDITSAMYTSNVTVPTINYSYGIGGRDVTEMQIESVYRDLQTLKNNENPYRFLGLKTK